MSYSLACSGHTGKAADLCWPSEPSPVNDQLQTRTLAPALLRPVDPPCPWRYSQIYSNLDRNPSPSLLRRGALLCRAVLGQYLSPSQCPERTTVNPKPCLSMFTRYPPFKREVGREYKLFKWSKWNNRVMFVPVKYFSSYSVLQYFMFKHNSDRGICFYRWSCSSPSKLNVRSILF